MIKISEDICIRGRLNFSIRKRLNQLSLSCCIYFCRKGTLFRSRLFLAWNHNCYRVFWRSSNLTNDRLLTGYGRLEMRHYNGKGSVLFSVRNRLKAEMPFTYEACSLDICCFETLSKLPWASHSYFQVSVHFLLGEMLRKWVLWRFRLRFVMIIKKGKRILAERMGRILFGIIFGNVLRNMWLLHLKSWSMGRVFFLKWYLAICLRGCDWPVDHSFSCMFLASLNKYSLRTFMRLNAYNLKHLQLLKRLQLFWDLANSLFFVQSKACFTAAFIEWALFPIRTHGWQ